MKLEREAQKYARTQIPTMVKFMREYGEKSEYEATYLNVAHWLKMGFDEALQEAIEEAQEGE